MENKQKQARKPRTSNAVKDRWKAANYTRVNIYLPKDDAAAYKAKCAAEGLALSDIPKRAIYEYLGGERAPEKNLEKNKNRA